MSFKGKLVLITGASSGIGSATAISFAKKGANVALVGRREEKLLEVTRKCKEHGNEALAIVADISKEEEVKGIVKKVSEVFGKLDVLVNNAGVAAKGGLLSGNLMESYDKVMNTNLRSVMHVTSLAAPLLIKSKGNVVNVSSVVGTTVFVRTLCYSISKAGLDHFSKGAAVELAPYGVRVNIVSPGPVSTDLMKKANVCENMEDFGQLCPLKKIASTQEVADLIMFLASDEAKSITGANYYIDNGILLPNFP